MRRYFIALVALLLMSSCYHVNEQQVDIPEKLLTENELADVITQMQITESGFIVTDIVIRRSNKPKYYKAILEEYNVTLDDVRDNMIYYQSQPKVMEGIYEIVLENLSKIQSKVDEEIKLQKAIEDSLKALNDSIHQKNIDTSADSLKVNKNKVIN